MPMRCGLNEPLVCRKPELLAHSPRAPSMVPMRFGLNEPLVCRKPELLAHLPRSECFLGWPPTYAIQLRRRYDDGATFALRLLLPRRVAHFPAYLRRSS